MSDTPVLVTGGSGFIAGHCILQLLARGTPVRATVRSLSRQTEARRALEEAGMTRGDLLTFAAADLLADAGWAEATHGIEQVLHVASPVLPGHVENEDDVIVPAVEGALRLLRAARTAGVRRVVLTSAFHAVSWGHGHDPRVFDESDWTNLDGRGVDAYGRSKTIAERAAWDFVAREGGGLELTTLLPVAVMGEVVGRDISGSNHVIQRLLNGAMPGLPDLYLPIVDVRDVATAHIAALDHAEAAGQRFLISNGPPLGMKEIAAILRAALGDSAHRVPTRTLPTLLMRLMGLFNLEIRPYVADLGYIKKTTNEKARRLLDWTPRDPREAIVAAGRSMVAKGLLAA